MTDLADEPTSLLDWATRLAVDPGLRARLAADPRGLLDEQGFARVAPADLHHALPLVTDAVAARLGHDVDGGLVGAVEAQGAGEHPLDALARHFTHVSDTVLAGPPTSEPHDLDALDRLPGDDPTALLDDPGHPDAPDDLDDLDGFGGPHDPGHHDVGAPFDDHVPADVPAAAAGDPGPPPPEAGPVVGNEVTPDPGPWWTDDLPPDDGDLAGHAVLAPEPGDGHDGHDLGDHLGDHLG